MYQMAWQLLRLLKYTGLTMNEIELEFKLYCEALDRWCDSIDLMARTRASNPTAKEMDRVRHYAIACGKCFARRYEKFTMT